MPHDVLKAVAYVLYAKLLPIAAVVGLIELLLRLTRSRPESRPKRKQNAQGKAGARKLKAPRAAYLKN